MATASKLTNMTGLPTPPDPLAPYTDRVTSTNDHDRHQSRGLQATGVTEVGRDQRLGGTATALKVINDSLKQFSNQADASAATRQDRDRAPEHRQRHPG